MPRFQAQLENSVSKEDQLEERAWNHYYRNHTCPASQELINLIKDLLTVEEEQKKT